MNKSLQLKLSQYVALSSLAAFSASEYSAQIIHRNINYIGGYTSYDIDVDGDAFGDFNFQLKTQTGTYFSYFDFYVKGINVVGKNENAILGRSGILNIANSLSSGDYVFNSGYFYRTFIKSGFLGGTYQLTDFYSSYTSSSSGTFGFPSDLLEYKFLGFEFDINGDNHFGWMRIKFSSADGSSYFIKDLAYNSVPKATIKAGEMPLVTVEDNIDDMLEIKALNNQLYLQVTSQYIGEEIAVYDLTGKVVLSEVISGVNTQIPYNLPEGIYVVRMINEEKTITRKMRL